MNKNNWILMFTALLLIFSLAAGCAQATPAAVTPPAEPTSAPAQVNSTPTTLPVTITDALGRTVELDSPPQRIVVAGKSSTLILDALYMFPEALERVISYGKGSQTGKNFLSVIDPKINEKTAFESTVGAEQIAPLKPDLVILKDILKDSLGTPLEALGIKVVYMNLETPETFYRDVRTMGQIFGNTARAEAIVSYYEKSVAAVTDPLKDLKETDRPKALLLQYSNKSGTVAFNIPPATWLQTDLVKLAGGTPVWLDASKQGGWTVITLEQIAAWNPDMIFIVDYSGKATAVVTQLKADPQWSALSAVKNAQLYAFPVDFLSWDQPDPRWTLGLTWLATRLQPQTFTSVNMTAEVTQFYKTIYSMDDNAIDTQVLSILKGD